jgi:hypothetical protein
VTSNHFWWFEISKHSFSFAIFFVMQVFWFSMFWAWIQVGLDSYIVVGESVFWITKSLASCFCATIRLELFSTKFLVFCCVCYAQDLISSKCWVVVCCLCYYSLSMQELFLRCKHRLFANLGLKKFTWQFSRFCTFFVYKSFGNWTQTRPSP